MASPYHHALSSVKQWGGRIEDYLPIHNWFDASKELHGDFRHRALRHHTHGIFECERAFGEVLRLSNGKEIPTRWVGEQHVIEDVGYLPTLSDWVKNIQAEPWMTRNKKLSKELAMEAAK